MHQELLQNDLETFLTWFSKQEEIPLQIRRDFFRHLSEIGYLDEKSREFLAEIIPKILQKKEQKLINIKQKAKIFNNVSLMQKNPEFSLVEKIVKNASNWMMDQALKFKDIFKFKETKKAKKAETKERSQEMDLVAQLKAKFAR